jgi:hypothetical protein
MTFTSRSLWGGGKVVRWRGSAPQNGAEPPHHTDASLADS